MRHARRPDGSLWKGCKPGIVLGMLVIPALCLRAQTAPESWVSGATAASEPSLAEELPRTAHAAPDELVQRGEADSPVAPVERGLRLVASEARIAQDDLPTLSVGGDPVVSPPAGLTAVSSARLGEAANAANVNGAAASVSADAGARQMVPAPSLRAALPAQKSGGLSLQRPWLWLMPVACFFLAVIAWLFWIRRRGGSEDQAYVLTQEVEAAFDSAVEEAPFRPCAQLGKLPGPSNLAPRRLVHALAGLNAELGDKPGDRSGETEMPAMIRRVVG